MLGFYKTKLEHKLKCGELLPSLFPGRLQLEADRHTQNIKHRDTQVKTKRKKKSIHLYHSTQNTTVLNGCS